MGHERNTRHGWFAAGLYLALGVLLTQIPMLRQLGYESSLATALFTGLIFPIFAPLRLRQPAQGENVLSPLSLFGRLAFRHALLLLVPFTALVLYGRIVPNCAPGEGALFYLLMPLTSAMFLTALLVLLRTLLRRFVYLSYYTLLLVLLVLPVFEILSRPQLFAYSHYFGMFAGVTWDESQPPLLTLAYFRCVTAAYVLMMLSAAWMSSAGRVKAPRARAAAVVVFSFGLVSVLLLSSRGDELGFSSSKAHTQAVLGSRYESEHFVIWYPASTFSQREILRVAEEHEFRLFQVARDLKVPWNAKITSFIYPDRATKRRLLGTESSQIARPWMREIHLSADGWSSSLKHELVHVVAGEFGPYINRAPFVRVLGLVEGLAMAVEWEFGNRSLHQYAAGMLASGMLPHAQDVLSTAGFIRHSSSVGYVASGSFCRWLMDSAGVDLLKNAYAGDDLQGAAGVSWEELDSRWRRFLARAGRELPDSIAVQYSFGRVPIFLKVCPRTVTETNRAAWEAYAGGRFIDAAGLYKRSDSLGANAAAAFGFTRSLYQRAKYDSAISVIGGLLADSVRSASVYPLLLWQGASFLAAGRTSDAIRSFEVLLKERPAGWPVTEAAWFMAAIRDSSGDALVPTLIRSLEWNTDPDQARRSRLRFLDSLLAAHPQSALTAALRSRLLLALDTMMERAAQPVDLDRLPEGVRFETGMLRVRALGRLQRWGEALQGALEMKQRARFEEDALLLNDWEDRCRYFMKQSRAE